jgi:hypothetical protein
MVFTFLPLNQLTVCDMTFPASWASALVNDDWSGLDYHESKACRAQVAELAAIGWHVVDVARDADGNANEPRFSRCFDLYGGTAQGGDVLEYVAHKLVEAV